MACKVCSSDCNYKDMTSSFYIYVFDEFKSEAVVPCNKRAHFNNMTGDELTFKANERTYTVKCHEGEKKSVMHGKGWRSFVADNNLGKGQMVLFYLHEPSPWAAVTYIQIGNDSEDEQPTDENFQAFMACKVCSSDCNYKDPTNTFSIYVFEEFKSTAVVPCNKRARFNDLTEDELTFKANGRTYTVKCHKGHNKSVIHGKGWRNFVADNNLGKGQMVSFYLHGPSPWAAVSEDSHEDDETEEEEDTEVNISIMRTKGVQLNEQENWNLQLLLPLNNGFIGIPFVHRLTRTNVHLGSMKIPKKVAAASPFKHQGYSGVCLVGGRFRKIPYKTSDDGRIMLGSNKWKVFAASRNLVSSTAVLIAFKHSPASNLDVLISIKKLG